MCYRVTCPTCGKASWGGCGAHVEAVLGNVPKAERCRCHEQPASKPLSGASLVDKVLRR